MTEIGAQELREILKELKTAVPRAWGGSYVAGYLKQPDPAPDLQWLFHMTLAGNRPDLGRRLLDAGCDPHGVDPEGKLAWQHVREAEAASFLLEAGVPARAVTANGATSWIGWAVFNQKPAVVRLLLEQGVDLHHRNGEKRTPLMIAAYYGDAKIIRALLSAGAAVNEAIEYPALTETALTLAASRGNADAVRVLLEAGADAIRQGRDALWHVCRDRKKQNLQIVQDLLTAGAEPNGDSYTVLIRAAKSGSPDMLRALVAGGADLSAATVFGTALHATVDENRADNAATLLELGADPHYRCPDGCGEYSGLSALDYARKQKKKKVAAVLEAPGGAPATAAVPAVEQTWKRLEKWLRKHAPAVQKSLGKPATEEAIQAVERTIGQSLPADFRASLALHNGQAKDLTLVPPVESGDAGYSLLPLDRIAYEWTVWKELLDGGDFEGLSGGSDAGIRDDWWNPGWISVSTNGGGDSHCVDLSPAAGGVSGQVITMFHDESKRERVATGFAAWLAALADELEQGEWTLDDTGGIDRS
ncbi:MAG: glucan synthase 1-related protein [Armatimonadetes bacterium]|nr:glucan synthase 1-related protein [Armatimonadota bacterium]